MMATAVWGNASGVNPPTNQRLKEMSPREATPAVHTGFVATGMVTTLLGPLLPVLAARWSLSDVQGGALFLVQFTGSTLASLLLGAILSRWGFRLTLVLGFVLMCLGTAAVGLGSWPAALTALFFAGAGQGLTITASNLFIAEINPHRSAAALNLLNFSWCVGAVAWPPLVALGVRLKSVNALLLALCFTLGLIAIWLSRLPLAAPKQMQGSKVAPLLPRRESLNLRTLAHFGAMFFLYVGVEGSVGGWVASHMKRLAVTSSEQWILPPVFFWGSLLAGRAFAPVLLRRMQERSLLFIELLLATIGLILLFVADAPVTLIAGASLAGVGLASVFPILISFLKRNLGESSSRYAGLHFALGGAGGAALPWLVGIVSTVSGSLKMGLLVPLLGWLCLGALNLFRTNGNAPAAS